MLRRLYIPLFAILTIAGMSCMKQETPLILPSATGDQVDQVTMGDSYTHQIFYSLERGQPVKVSEINSWDLAFETEAEGDRIFLNGGKDLYLLPTGSKDFSQPLYIEDPRPLAWQFDSPSGHRDSTAFGNWNQGEVSKGEVYIVKINPAFYPDTFVKVQLLGVDPQGYQFQYGSLQETEGKRVRLEKDPQYNFVYFSFSQGEAVQPDPPRDSWDIVFTRYRHIYYDLDDFPYLVVGALLNPYHTEAGRVAEGKSFSEVSASDLERTPLSSDRNAIGFEWKAYDIDRGIYAVDPSQVFLVHTAKNQYYKLQFLDFYGSSSEPGQRVKGSPRFSFCRIQ